MDYDIEEQEIDTPRRAKSDASGDRDKSPMPEPLIEAEDFDLWRFAEEQMLKEGKSNSI
jgi:hypothetical protein